MKVLTIRKEIGLFCPIFMSLNFLRLITIIWSLLI